MFQFRHHNRVTMPTKHVLVCEDDLTNQRTIVDHFLKTFEPQGAVQFSFVCGSLAASAIIHHCQVDLVLLDHDMPHGNGSDLLRWMQEQGKMIPVITFSGIAENNTHMMNVGANHHHSKQDVFDGKADELIRSILFPS